MGRDFALSDKHPSVVINGRKYHYGREPHHGQFLVESAHYEKDYWCFNTREDLQAFLINLPESANHRGRIAAAYPDWATVTPEQRDAYLAEDRARQRTLAAEKLLAGTASRFNMDLEGEQGPYEPQRVEDAGKYTPLEHVEAQIAAFKAVEAAQAKQAGYLVASGEWPGGYTDALKLRVLEGEMNWSGISASDKEAVLSREVDFSKITTRQFAFVYEDIANDRMEPADPAVAQRLHDRSRVQTGQPAVRDTTANLVNSVMLDLWPGNAAQVDFGIDSQKHYEAIYYPLREGEISPQQLDTALGNGRMLTDLVKGAATNPHKDIVFRTYGDELHLDPPGSAESPGQRPSTDRQALLRQAFELARDAGYHGFRREYFNDPEYVKDWPDPAQRERELRAAWDEMADFRAFEQSHAGDDIQTLARVVEIYQAEASQGPNSELYEQTQAARGAEGDAGRAASPSLLDIASALDKLDAIAGSPVHGPTLLEIADARTAHQPDSAAIRLTDTGIEK